MKRVGSNPLGYTVVEVMVFFVITSALLLAAMAFMGGQQGRNEFGTGVRDVQSQLNDIINDITTGFYDFNTGNFTCSAPGTSGPPVIGSGSAPEQGTNASCTFVGRALQFSSADDGEGVIEVYTLVGRRQVGLPAVDVRNLSETSPIVLDSADKKIKLPYDMKVKKVQAASTDFGTVALVSRFAGNAGSGGISGTQDLDLVPVASSGFGQAITASKSYIKNNLVTSPANPNTGVVICLESGGSSQHATLTIGGPNRQASTSLLIEDGSCS